MRPCGCDREEPVWWQHVTKLDTAKWTVADRNLQSGLCLLSFGILRRDAIRKSGKLNLMLFSIKFTHSSRLHEKEGERRGGIIEIRFSSSVYEERRVTRHPHRTPKESWDIFIESQCFQHNFQYKFYAWKDQSFLRYWATSSSRRRIPRRPIFYVPMGKIASDRLDNPRSFYLFCDGTNVQVLYLVFTKTKRSREELFSTYRIEWRYHKVLQQQKPS